MFILCHLRFKLPTREAGKNIGAVMIRTWHPLAINGVHHVSRRVRDMERSLAFYQDVLGFSPKTSFLLDGLRFAMLETGNDVYIELVEMKQPMQPVGESEVFWHLALRTDDLEKSLEAAVSAGCEVTVPIRPLGSLE